MAGTSPAIVDLIASMRARRKAHSHLALLALRAELLARRAMKTLSVGLFGTFRRFRRLISRRRGGHRSSRSGGGRSGGGRSGCCRRRRRGGGRRVLGERGAGGKRHRQGDAGREKGKFHGLIAFSFELRKGRATATTLWRSPGGLIKRSKGMRQGGAPAQHKSRIWRI